MKRFASGSGRNMDMGKKRHGTIPFSGTFAGDITGLSADTDCESSDHEFSVLLHRKTICGW